LRQAADDRIVGLHGLEHFDYHVVFLEKIGETADQQVLREVDQAAFAVDHFMERGIEEGRRKDLLRGKIAVVRPAAVIQPVAEKEFIAKNGFR
jgi:hypothetical protein